MSKRRLFTIMLLIAVIVIPIAESTRVDARPAYCDPSDAGYDNPSGECMTVVTQDCPWYDFLARPFGYNVCTMNACTSCGPR